MPGRKYVLYGLAAFSGMTFAGFGMVLVLLEWLEGRSGSVNSRAAAIVALAAGFVLIFQLSVVVHLLGRQCWQLDRLRRRLREGPSSAHRDPERKRHHVTEDDR